MFFTGRRLPGVNLLIVLTLLGSGVFATIPVKPGSALFLQSGGSVHFAVVGDFGVGSQGELDVANRIKSWNPEFVITVGDNNYPTGSASTIDQNIGQYYHEFIFPYTGSFGQGADTNRFLPSLGNHDWDTTNAQPYLNYFTLPGNERYYDFVWGPVHFFVVDSDSREPDGITSTSVQAAWLQGLLASSTSPWNLVYMHHPPYTSGGHGSTTTLQWPYAMWGADAVLAGHDHDYERILRNGIPYFVDGLGGAPISAFGAPISGSQVRYNADYGAMLVDASEAQITFQFITRTGALIDTYTLNSLSTPTATQTSTSTKTATSTPVPPSSTSTSTHTFTPTFTSTNTATRTATSTSTSTPIPPSSTPTATHTFTPTAAPTGTATKSPTPTYTVTFTRTRTATATSTNTPIPPSNTPTATHTSTFTPAATGTSSRTPTSTATKTPTATYTITFTPSATPSRTPTITATRTNTATSTYTATGAPTPTKTATSTPTPDLSATSLVSTLPPYLKSEVLVSASLSTQSGSTSGTAPSLGSLQQNGVEDNPAAYVAFQTPGSVYIGYQSFYLLDDIRPSLIATLLLQINFKGPAPTTQTWTWFIYDWNTGMWILIGDTAGLGANQWQTLLFRIRNPQQYISPAQEIRIQLRSNNANGDAKIDYEALHITYRPVGLTPTNAAPTVPAGRPGILSARIPDRPSEPSPTPWP